MFKSKSRVAPNVDDPKDVIIANLRREASSNKGWIEHLESQVVGLQGEVEDLNYEVKSKDDTILDLNKKITELEKTVSTQNVRLEANVGDAAGFRQAIETQSTIFANSIAKTTADFTEAKKKLRASSARLLAQKEEITDLRKRLDGLTENLEQEAKALACKMHDFKETENKALRVVVDFTRNRLECLQDVISSRTLMLPCPWCAEYYDITDYNFKVLYCGCTPCKHCIDKELAKNKPNSPIVRCKDCRTFCTLQLSFKFIAK